jgi:hypothetical protein
MGNSWADENILMTELFAKNHTKIKKCNTTQLPPFAHVYMKPDDDPLGPTNIAENKVLFFL